MENNFLFKILLSLPIILIMLYFIPFLGVCLILFRYIMYRHNKYYITPIAITICGILLVIPYITDSIIKMFNLNNVKIPYLDSIVTADIYVKLLNYGKLLITVGIIFLILSFIFRNIFNNISNKLRNCMEKDLQKDYEIRKENDLIMQEKRERAKQTHVVYCKHCGADNILTSNVGTCKFCRRKIQ